MEDIINLRLKVCGVMGLVSFGLGLSRGWLLSILNASLDFIKFLDWKRKCHILRDPVVQS